VSHGRLPNVRFQVKFEAHLTPEQMKAKKSGNRSVGTIRASFTRCVLEEVRLIGSDVREEAADMASRQTPETELATHFTRLGQVQYDTPRRAYKIVSEHRMPWATMLFVYGHRQMLEIWPLDQLDLSVRPNPPRIPAAGIPRYSNTLPTLMKIFTGYPTWGDEAQPAASKPIVAKVLSPVAERHGNIVAEVEANLRPLSLSNLPETPTHETKPEHKPHRRKLSLSFRRGTAPIPSPQDDQMAEHRARGMTRNQSLS